MIASSIYFNQFFTSKYIKYALKKEKSERHSKANNGHRCFLNSCSCLKKKMHILEINILWLLNFKEVQQWM